MITILTMFTTIMKIMMKMTIINGHTHPNKTISDGGITVDFWIIKVHTSN